MSTALRQSGRASPEQQRAQSVDFDLGSDSPSDSAQYVHTDEARPDGAAAERAMTCDYLLLARRVAHRYRHRGIDDDDLEQVATLGLVKAVHRWRPERGRFVSYATPTIDGELKRYFRDTGTTIKIPRQLYETQPKVTAAAQTLRQRLGHEPTVTDIAREACLSEQRVREVHSAVANCQPLSTDDDNGPETTAARRTETETSSTSERADLYSALRTLGRRDKHVVALRFIWGQSQMQIAENIGVSQMQVSRILRAALDKLHDAMVTNHAA